jgi:hypothetical protein
MALTGATGLAKCAKIATPEPMRAGPSQNVAPFPDLVLCGRSGFSVTVAGARWCAPAFRASLSISSPMPGRQRSQRPVMG